jgi:hypothetical protein
LILVCGLLLLPAGFCICQLTTPESHQHNGHDDDCPAKDNIVVEKTIADSPADSVHVTDITFVTAPVSTESDGGRHSGFTSYRSERPVQQLFVRHCALLL